MHDDPRRHVHRRRRDEEGQPVELRDWWLPHFYQQRTLTLQPTGRKRKKQRSAPLPIRLGATVPDPPRYAFGGRARELLQIERWLLRGKLVVVHGFGGVGKTALVREAADWLTRTGMYTTAYLHSFEHGDNAVALLSALGRYFNVYDGAYNPTDSKVALSALRPSLRARPLLLLADNVETILASGDAALELQARTQLWNVLLALVDTGVGVLLTTRDTNFGDRRIAGGRQVAYLPLLGLDPEDSYALATRLLNDLNIDRRRAPYASLRDFLVQLDHHPLAIQLVLPALRDYTLESIRNEFVALLPRFADDVETGRNRSLLASLDYSLRRLTSAQRASLLRLTPFEGGAVENGIPTVTGISGTEWATLRVALEQAALIIPQQIQDKVTFLRFHPVLIPFLRSQSDLDAKTEATLNVQYINWYYMVSTFSEGIKKKTVGDEQALTTLLHCEMPNFRRALKLLAERGDLERLSKMGEDVVGWLDRWGWNRERDDLRQWLAEAITAAGDTAEGVLTERSWQLEHNRAQNEMAGNNFAGAEARYMALLARIEAMSEGEALGSASYLHLRTLSELAKSLQSRGQLARAEQRIRQALTLLEDLIKDHPNRQKSYLEWKTNFLSSLGDILWLQHNYKQAKVAYEDALKGRGQDINVSVRARFQAQLGSVALAERDYEAARAHYTETLTLFQSWGDRTSEAVAWHQLGQVAKEQKLWSEAERCYRESLAIKEEQGDFAEAASTYSNLATVAQGAGRSTEAEGWHRRAMAVSGLPPPLQATIRLNFVDFLLEELQAGHAGQDSLVEARQLAEDALAIQETLDTAPNIMRILGHLVTIAEMEGRTEAARDYRRRERESSAASGEVRRLVDGAFGQLIAATGALIVQADPEALGLFEETLKAIETLAKRLAGDKFNSLIPSLRRIWEGERDWNTLSEALNRVEAVVVLRVLETISQLSAVDMTPRQVIASLPMAIRDAMDHRDPAVLDQAMQALSPLERQATVAALQKIKQSANSLLDEFEPLLRAVAEVALGNNARRSEVEQMLITRKNANQLRQVVRRIWAGERNAEVLVEGLIEPEKALIHRILKIITQVTEALAPVLEQSAGLLDAIAKAALGDNRQRSAVDAILSEDQKFGQFQEVVRRIWAGERDIVQLTMGLGLLQIALVRRVLEIIDQNTERLATVIKLLEQIAVVARSDNTHRSAIEDFLVDLEQNDLHLTEAVRRIWAGERDEDALTAQLDALNTSLVRLLLKMIAQQCEAPATTPEQILASLPPNIRDAYQRNDVAALQYATLFVPPEKKQDISNAITLLNEKEHQSNMAAILKASVPILEAIADAALGEDSRRTQIEELLPSLEAKGFRIREAVYRIWAGERDGDALTKGLNEVETVLVIKALEFIQVMPLLVKVAAVALHDETHRSDIETALPGLEAKGIRIREAVHRIWSGERDADTLTEGLNEMSATFVARILELISDILKRFEPLLNMVAIVARGDDTHRSVVEKLLAGMNDGRQFQEAVHRIWAGESDPDVLTEGLNKFYSSLVVRMLEYISKIPAPAQGTESASRPN